MSSDAVTTTCPRSPADTDWVETEVQGLRWRLCMQRYIDREIATTKVFEPATTELVRRIVRPGMRVLDVGANLGYFTLLFARQVGPTGRVWAFEPVERYREQLRWHVAANGFEDRVQICDYGLSDASITMNVALDWCGGTLHWTRAEAPDTREPARFLPLDVVASELGLNHVDFVKLDVDGHEPFFFRGASAFFRHNRPLMVVEFSQANLDVAGEDVRTLKEAIEELGYTLYSERTGKSYANRHDFLFDAGNFTHSANVWAVPDTLATPGIPLDQITASSRA